MEFFLLELISSLLIKRGTRHLTELYVQLLGKCCNASILGKYFWTGNAVILVVLGKDNCCVVEFVLVCETSNFVMNLGHFHSKEENNWTFLLVILTVFF